MLTNMHCIMFDFGNYLRKRTVVLYIFLGLAVIFGILHLIHFEDFARIFFRGQKFSSNALEVDADFKGIEEDKPEQSDSKFARAERGGYRVETIGAQLQCIGAQDSSAYPLPPQLGSK